MSRTFRRRDKQGLSREIKRDLEIFASWQLMGKPRFYPSYRVLRGFSPDAADRDVIRRVVALFHADRPGGQFSAPSWFRRMLNARYRAKEKAALRRAVADEADDVKPSVKRYADWDWF